MATLTRFNEAVNLSMTHVIGALCAFTAARQRGRLISFTITSTNIDIHGTHTGGLEGQDYSETGL